MLSLPLESKFQVARLKLYLDKYPETAIELAIEHYEDFLALTIEHQKLKTKLGLTKAYPANSLNYQD